MKRQNSQGIVVLLWTVAWCGAATVHAQPAPVAEVTVQNPYADCVADEVPGHDRCLPAAGPPPVGFKHMVPDGGCIEPEDLTGDGDDADEVSTDDQDLAEELTDEEDFDEDGCPSEFRTAAAAKPTPAPPPPPKALGTSVSPPEKEKPAATVKKTKDIIPGYKEYSIKMCRKYLTKPSWKTLAEIGCSNCIDILSTRDDFHVRVLGTLHPNCTERRVRSTAERAKRLLDAACKANPDPKKVKRRAKQLRKNYRGRSKMFRRCWNATKNAMSTSSIRVRGQWGF